jgi:hypothetical protein
VITSLGRKAPACSRAIVSTAPQTHADAAIYGAEIEVGKIGGSSRSAELDGRVLGDLFNNVSFDASNLKDRLSL